MRTIYILVPLVLLLGRYKLKTWRKALNFTALICIPIALLELLNGIQAMKAQLAALLGNASADGQALAKLYQERLALALKTEWIGWTLWLSLVVQNYVQHRRKNADVPKNSPPPQP